jgi:hypothetical protein
LILKGKKYFVASEFFRLNNHKAAIKSTSIVMGVQMECATNDRFLENLFKVIVQHEQNRRIGSCPSSRHDAGSREAASVKIVGMLSMFDILKNR